MADPLTGERRTRTVTIDVALNDGADFGSVTLDTGEIIDVQPAQGQPSFQVEMAPEADGKGTVIKVTRAPVGVTTAAVSVTFNEPPDGSDVEVDGPEGVEAVAEHQDGNQPGNPIEQHGDRGTGAPAEAVYGQDVQADPGNPAGDALGGPSSVDSGGLGGTSAATPGGDALGS